jgi:hypothetical protein
MELKELDSFFEEVTSRPDYCIIVEEKQQRESLFLDCWSIQRL